MKSTLIFYRKNMEPNGDIVEMRIWKIPSSKRFFSGLKYSLVFIREGQRIIGYDNAEGKGTIGIIGAKNQPMIFATWTV